jgi:ribokinase
MLKLSEEESAVLAGGGERERALDALSAVPELLVTLGPQGVEVRVDGAASRVSPDRVVTNVHATGAGDAFVIAYLIERHRGLAPVEAAVVGADVAAAMLAERSGVG